MHLSFPSIAKSIALHASLVFGIAWFLANDAGHVDGSAGLAGRTHTRFDVRIDAVRPTPIKPENPKTLSAHEGIPVEEKKAVPPRPPEDPSKGSTDSAPSGSEGQAGSGSTASDKIGDADRTNRLGIYLLKMTQKIQSNLGSAGYIAFSTRAKLLLDLRKDGYVTKIVVLESSGEATLDRLAIRAVEKSNPFDPWESDQKIQLPVVFR